MANAKTTKKALFGSCMAMLLCVSMLIGSTFAWFTDTASTGLNKIMAGNLDVELRMFNGTEYADISNDDKPIFGTYDSSIAQDVNIDTLWEPGKTQVAYLMIRNAGNLALKYQVALNTINPADGKDLYKVMEYQIVPDVKNGTGATWKAGAGNGVTPGIANVSGDTLVPMQKGDEHYFALLIHMDENAGNEYMKGKVEFDISVLATQLNSEADSFGTDYDKEAFYSDFEAATADEMIEAISQAGPGEVIGLMNDVNIDPAGMSNAYGTTGINIKNGQTLDGNGNTLDIKGAGGTWDSGINTTGGIIRNLTVTGSFRGIFVNHNSEYSAPVILENVIIDGTVYTISCDQGTGKGLTATGCTFKGWTSYAATIGNVEFTDCYFGKGSGYAYCRPYAPTTFVGCEFEAGFEMDTRAAVTFENCTLDGVALTEANLSTLVTSNIANATVK